jgi:hypothetical protein
MMHGQQNVKLANVTQMTRHAKAIIKYASGLMQAVRELNNTSY